MTHELIARSPEADWRRDGDVWTCSLSHGSAIVRPGANGGWDVEREIGGEIVDQVTIHDGLDGTAAEQIADVVLGWGG